jgi:hypothetical protein
LADSTAVESLAGVTDSLKFVESMSVQVVPSLLSRVYCCVLATEMGPEPVGEHSAVRRVGEKAPPIGPAPTQIVPGSALFAFSFSVMLYVAPEVSGRNVCTKAAFGLKVPAKPPLSFQATILPAPYVPPETQIPMSWL